MNRSWQRKESVSKTGNAALHRLTILRSYRTHSKNVRPIKFPRSSSHDIVGFLEVGDYNPWSSEWLHEKLYDWRVKRGALLRDPVVNVGS